jgi:hypothetical protein
MVLVQVVCMMGQFSVVYSRTDDEMLKVYNNVYIVLVTHYKY